MNSNLRSSSPYRNGDSCRDSARSTDNKGPASFYYLGTAPHKCFVSEMRFHKTPAWAVLLFC